MLLNQFVAVPPFNAVINLIGVRLMGFVIFVGALGAFGMAVAYAIRPTEAKLALMRPLSLASIFAAVCSFFGGLIAVLQGVAATTAAPSGLTQGSFALILMGLSETLVPLFVSFALLAVAWLLVALGIRRHA